MLAKRTPRADFLGALLATSTDPDMKSNISETLRTAKLKAKGRSYRTHYTDAATLVVRTTTSRSTHKGEGGNHSCAPVLVFLPRTGIDVLCLCVLRACEALHHCVTASPLKALILSLLFKRANRCRFRSGSLESRSSPGPQAQQSTTPPSSSSAPSLFTSCSLSFFPCSALSVTSLPSFAPSHC